MNLNASNLIAELDSQDMVERIKELPQQCQAAWQQSQNLSLPADYGKVQHIVAVGMGGSAIGGALLQGLVAEECQTPITIVRGYELPAFINGSDYLVIGCSYSGNTEETLSAFGQAIERETRVLAVTTDGKLTKLVQEKNFPIVPFDYQSQPRAALGYSFTLLLGIGQQLGLLRDYSADIEEAIQIMRSWQAEIGPDVPLAKNAAKQLAQQIEGHLPVIYGTEFSTAVANRWKTQFNENAKHWAFFEALPEMNHNSVVGFGIPQTIRDHTIALLLRSNLDHPRVQKRWDVTRELLAREGVTAEEINGRGESKLAQMLSLIHFGDYVSFYLAMLNEVDPTPVEAIAFLKRRLAKAAS